MTEKISRKISLNKLYCEDCIPFMQNLPDQCLDVIVTSPPYNIGKEYTVYSDTKERETYLNWMEAVAKESFRVIRDGGSFFLNVGGKPSDLAIPYDVSGRFRKYFHLQNDIVWVKSIAISKESFGRSNGFKTDLSVGHYKPIQSKRFLNNCHESIFHFTKNCDTELDKLAIGVPYQDKTNIDRWGTREDKRDRGDVWFIPYETIQESRPHPASFPVNLPLMCIKLHGVKKDLAVYDPFVGIGTTPLACIKLGVNYLGTDIDPNYLEIASERIKGSLSQLKLEL